MEGEVGVSRCKLLHIGTKNGAYCGARSCIQSSGINHGGKSCLKKKERNGFHFESFCFEFGFLCGGWCHARASLVAQTVENPPAMQETRV